MLRSALLALFLLSALPLVASAQIGVDGTYVSGVMGPDLGEISWDFPAADTTYLRCGGAGGGCIMRLDGVIVAQCTEFNVCYHTFSTEPGTHPVHTVRMILSANQPYSITGHNVVINGQYSNHWASAVSLIPASMSPTWFINQIRSMTSEGLGGELMIYLLGALLTFMGIATFKKIVREAFGRGRIINNGVDVEHPAARISNPRYMDVGGSQRVRRPGEFRD
jgi:hypothetical protein